MQYRSFGKLDFKPSALGFGCMRLPVIDEDDSKIDEKEAIKMIRYGIDNGINYIDTAYKYHKGNSEGVVGKALKDGYREKVKLADKLPSWMITSKKDPEQLFNEQLKRLDDYHIDMYLMHALNWENWDKIKKYDCLNWAEEKKKEGKISHLGFSFHDEFEVFKEIIDYYDKWEFVQIQYNYLDENFQAGMKGLQYAASKGLAVVIMEPLKGGKLARLPKNVKNIYDKSSVKRTPADWALQWLWNQREVSVVLSGMSTMQHVKENIKSAENSKVNSLSKEELETIKKAKEEYLKICPIPCTRCNYCMPCPNGVNIPGNFELYNEYKAFKDLGSVKWKHDNFKEKAKAKSCIKCGLCEPKCPQGIKIMEWLEKVAKEFK
jgi:predicted aldo/keto reductase-like oxidoreductase